KGEFAVAHSNAEFINTIRNARLLKQLSERTGGTYVPFDSVSGFWNKLDQRGLLEQKQQQETTFIYPYQSISWFIMMLIILGSEWILRKYLALP
ncbi:MAG: hypothetical protein PVI44_14930, partial [Balneolaceae bacterium]